MKQELSNHLANSDRLVVIVHAHADLDSIGSAVAIAKTVDAAVDIALPPSVQADAEALLADVAVVSDPDLTTYDAQIVVDAPSSQRIGPLDPTTNEVPLLVVDHHTPGNLRDHATAAYIDTDAPATAYLIATLFDENGVELSPEAAMALVAGILDDTGFRAVVMPDVQSRTLALLERARSMTAKLATLWETDPSWSERMATAKALVRAHGYKTGQTVLLTSHVGGEETAAAHALLNGNADIAIILSARGDRTRVVGRTADSLRHEISLPEDVLQPLATDFGGDGGGHASAGTATLNSDDREAIEAHTVTHIEDALGMQFGTFS